MPILKDLYWNSIKWFTSMIDLWGWIWNTSKYEENEGNLGRKPASGIDASAFWFAIGPHQEVVRADWDNARRRFRFPSDLSRWWSSSLLWPVADFGRPLHSVHFHAIGRRGWHPVLPRLSDRLFSIWVQLNLIWVKTLTLDSLWIPFISMMAHGQRSESKFHPLSWIFNGISSYLNC